MQLADPLQYVGNNVRIRSHGSSQHFGRGRLLRIEGQYGVVKPFQRHRQEERVPLEDLYTWAGGNHAGSDGNIMQNETETSNSPAMERYVVADVQNMRFFVSTWAGFKPELNRARLYDRLRSVNHAASMLRRRPKDEVGSVSVLTVTEAEQLMQERYHPQQVPEPTGVCSPVEPVSTLSLRLDLATVSPESMHKAADILKRLADVEVLYRDTIAELEHTRAESELEIEKLRSEWHALVVVCSRPAQEDPAA